MLSVLVVLYVMVVCSMLMLHCLIYGLSSYFSMFMFGVWFSSRLFVCCWIFRDLVGLCRVYGVVSIVLLCYVFCVVLFLWFHVLLLMY